MVTERVVIRVVGYPSVEMLPITSIIFWWRITSPFFRENGILTNKDDFGYFGFGWISALEETTIVKEFPKRPLYSAPRLF